MDLRLAEDMWELHQKFESVVKPWAMDATDKLRKFSDNAKLVVSGDEDKPHTYTVKFVVANYNYKDTETPDFWDPFIRAFGNSDFPKAKHRPRSIWAKVERDSIMSHDEDTRVPGFPVTTLYDYIDGNLKVTETELFSLSKKLGEEWKELAEHTLDELTPNFIDKYMNKDVDFLPKIPTGKMIAKNAPLIGPHWSTPGGKTLQGKVKKVKVVVQSDRICKARFVIHANGWKKPTPNLEADAIRNVWD